jgi:hypothetical protein
MEPGEPRLQGIRQPPGIGWVRQPQLLSATQDAVAERADVDDPGRDGLPMRDPVAYRAPAQRIDHEVQHP